MITNTTFTAPQTLPGSTMTTINVSRDGVPFGKIWTFKNTKTDKYGWHAKTLNGSHKLFDSGDKKIDMVDAQLWIAEQNH